jgi:hypothetical protein
MSPTKFSNVLFKEILGALKSKFQMPRAVLYLVTLIVTTIEVLEIKKLFFSKKAGIFEKIK